mgnify:CR=1 FL=1
MPRRSQLRIDNGRHRWRARSTALAAAGLFSLTGLFAQVLPRSPGPVAIEQIRLLAEWKGARSIADRYVVMSRGEVIAQGDGVNMEADGVRDLVAV